jgi:threonine aldolase
MIFASDTWSAASDKVIAALAEQARRGGPAYGSDPLTGAVEKRFAELFEREVAVFLVGSGTAANTLALSTFARPGGVILCHREAHIRVDESGASELLGSRCLGLDGRGGKIAPEAVVAALRRFNPDHVHGGQAVAISLTNITELGMAYQPAEIAAIAAVAKQHGLPVHLDGARFAGAVASLGLSPADISWRAGVDVISFGGTKNGCIAAEAVVFFNPGQARDFPYARQRAGHGFAKGWFLAAQFDAYLEDGHWLDLARHANAMGARLGEAVRRSRLARLALDPAANEVFAILPKALDQKLKAAGAIYGPWSADSFAADERPGPDELLVRLVATWQTKAEDVDRFGAVLNQA